MIREYFDGVKNNFGNCIKLQEDIYGQNSLEVADKYIKIAEVIYNSFSYIAMGLDDEQAKEYLGYFEQMLVKSFEIKKDILGTEDKQTKDICYELYQYYMASSFDFLMYKELIEDKKKALYYGELYIGE